MKTKNENRYVDELRVETDGEQDPSSEARFWKWWNFTKYLKYTYELI